MTFLKGNCNLVVKTADDFNNCGPAPASSDKKCNWNASINHANANEAATNRAADADADADGSRQISIIRASTNSCPFPFDEARVDNNGGMVSGTGSCAPSATAFTGKIQMMKHIMFKPSTSSLSSTPCPLVPTQPAASLATEPVAKASTVLSNQTEPTYYYFTSPPRRSNLIICFRRKLSFALQLREFRHSSCLMTPISTFVLLAILLSSFLTATLTFPQFIIGLLLGPILQRKFWLVQFLYRSNVAKWGHLKLFTIVGQSKKDKRSAAATTTSTSSSTAKANSSLLVVGSHSQTLQQRIVVVPNRVYIHPIPQFIDNIAYLIVCTPPPPDDNKTSSSPSQQSSQKSSLSSSSSIPIIAILIDCGESTKIMEHMERIYEHYYSHDFPRRTKCRQRSKTTSTTENTISTTEPFPEMELLGIFCTHRHHDHTAGVGPLISELRKRRLSSRENGVDDDDGFVVSTGCSSSSKGIRSSTSNDMTNTQRDRKQNQQCDIYKQAPGNIVVVGGAVENVPHCNVFVKNGCFVPLPCVTRTIHNNGDKSNMLTLKNDMNDIVSMEVIGVPSHTRGSVVFALRNRMAPNIDSILPSHIAQQLRQRPPPQTHLFTGDTIFTGGGGVPFESDLQFRKDDFIKTPAALKGKHGSSKFRPGAGVLSMERCFVEVLTRADGPWSKVSSSAELLQSQQLPSQVSEGTTTTLVYPGHEYTTNLLMRQFDQKNLSGDIHWSKSSPSTFFEVASHYLVSAHRRELMPEQRILTVPTPLEKEMIVNPNFRVLKRRGDYIVDALKLWYQFGTKNSLCPRIADHDRKQPRGQHPSVFTTVYSDHLVNVVKDLRSGKLDALTAADQIESLSTALDEKLIGRRPIPGTLPSHKNVYLGVVALAILGSAPSAVTVSDGNIMNLALPVDSTDHLMISKTRLIAALDRLGLLRLHNDSPRVEDIIHLLWREARIDDELKLDIEYTNGSDVECSINYKDEIELGLLKLALYGVALNQSAKFCLPCFDSQAIYDARSWVNNNNLRRTTGEMVRHDAQSCLACRDVWRSCLTSKSTA